MTRLWSKEFGEGIPLVMIHGMGSASTAWSLITPDLAKAFRVIHIDLPGHGFSKMDPSKEMDPHYLAERVLEELNNLNVDKFHVVGNLSLIHI